MNITDITSKLKELEDKITALTIENTALKNKTENLQDDLKNQKEFSDYVIESLDKTVSIMEILIGVLKLKDLDGSDLDVNSLLKNRNDDYYQKIIKMNIRKRKIYKLLLK